MSEITNKLKIYKAANATTYTCSIYSTEAEANSNPLRVQVDGTTRYVAADTSPPSSVATPLKFQKGTTTYTVKTNGYTSGSKTFTSSGTFTVPAGVTKIYVTASAGGGGGGGGGIHLAATTGGNDMVALDVNGGNGGAGGATKFGSLLSLSGGGGGGGAKGASNGSAGTNQTTTVVNSSYGGGGNGGAGYTMANHGTGGTGGKGGRGANCSNKALTVTPGTSYTVTIGAKGSGGTKASGVYHNKSNKVKYNVSATAGSAGQAGYMYISW